MGTDGSIYAAGLTEGAFPTQTSAGGSDVFVVKLRPDGSQEWLRQFGTDQKERTDAVPEDRSVALTLDSAGDLYIVGSTQGTFAGETSAGLGDAFISRMDASGKQAWLHQFGSVSHDALLAVTPNPAGGVYAVGWAKGPVGNQIQLGGQDALLVAEVLSPTTARHDRLTKRRIYMEEGVGEYWIVDADARTIERWRPGQDRPEMIDGVLRWEPAPNVPPLDLDVGAMFEEALGE